VEPEVKILEWFKENNKDFPHLALFFMANGAFQPTSLSSERLFNKNKLLFGSTRKRPIHHLGNLGVFDPVL
jgi:hypothetical protein